MQVLQIYILDCQIQQESIVKAHHAMNLQSNEIKKKLFIMNDFSRWIVENHSVESHSTRLQLLDA